MKRSTVATQVFNCMSMLEGLEFFIDRVIVGSDYSSLNRIEEPCRKGFPSFVGEAFPYLWDRLSPICGTCFPPFLGEDFPHFWEKISPICGRNFGSFVGRGVPSFMGRFLSFLVEAFSHLWENFSPICGRVCPSSRENNTPRIVLIWVI